MNYVLGSIPLLMYLPDITVIPPPGEGFLLITDGSDFLLTDNTPMETAGP